MKKIVLGIGGVVLVIWLTVMVATATIARPVDYQVPIVETITPDLGLKPSVYHWTAAPTYTPIG